MTEMQTRIAAMKRSAYFGSASLAVAFATNKPLGGALLIVLIR